MESQNKPNQMIFSLFSKFADKKHAYLGDGKLVLKHSYPIWRVTLISGLKFFSRSSSVLPVFFSERFQAKTQNFSQNQLIFVDFRSVFTYFHPIRGAQAPRIG